MAENEAMNRAGKILGKSKRLFDVNIGGRSNRSRTKRRGITSERSRGKFLLVTTTGLAPDEAMGKYKELGTVERAFGKIKNSLEIRPIYHYNPGRVRVHIFLCILGLLIHEIIEKLTQLNSRQEEIFERLDIDAPKELKVQEDLW